MNLFGQKHKMYSLPLTRNYVAHWGLKEAVRELLQNAIDSDSPFRCTFIDGVLRIVSEDSHLPRRTLLLGATSKAHDETKVGSFGEGYKIAMLVLCRIEKPVTIYNDKVIWAPQFAEDRSFGEETLHVAEAERESGWSDRLIFEISNISDDEYEEIKATCMNLWSVEEIGEVIETAHGQIMTQHQGKIFVNGLFVCDHELDFAYNVKPNFLRLERDRQTVNGFDIKLLTKNMWFDTEQYDKIAELIESESPDMEYADFGTPALVKEAVYRRFIQKNPGAVAAKSQAELDRYVAAGVREVVYVNDTTHTILNTVPEYKRVAHVKTTESPREVLETWLRANRQYLRKEAIVNFKDLISKAQGWSIKGS